MLLEVDDFIIGVHSEYQCELNTKLTERFQFGKFAFGNESYAGREIVVKEDRIDITQEKYILEQLHPVPLSKGRKKDRNAPLQSHEFAAARSLLYKTSWVAKETRPEAAGMCSISASRLHVGTIEDIHLMNRMVGHLRSTAQRPLIRSGKSSLVTCHSSPALMQVEWDRFPIRQIQMDWCPMELREHGWFSLRRLCRQELRK